MANANQWDADWSISEELVRKWIDRQFPQLSSKRIKLAGNGWDNTVFRVGDDYIFRFPRRNVAVKLIQLEGRLLPKLADFVTIAYPRPLFYGEASDEYPLPFLGYTYGPDQTKRGISAWRSSL